MTTTLSAANHLANLLRALHPLAVAGRPAGYDALLAAADELYALAAENAALAAENQELRDAAARDADRTAVDQLTELHTEYAELMAGGASSNDVECMLDDHLTQRGHATVLYA